MHTIITRTPTPEENQRIAVHTRHSIASYVYIAIFLGIVPAWALGKLGAWGGSLISPEASSYGLWSGWTVAAILFVSALVKFIPYERRQHRRVTRDCDSQVIQEIHVKDPQVIEICSINDNAPILAFEIGDSKILYLQGQWLFDNRTYSAEPLEGDPLDEYINGLPAPNSFPSNEFTVSRFQNSGEVVGIKVTGEYLPQNSKVDALKQGFEFCDSELFDGSIDDIAGVLVSEHERRKTG